MLVALLRLCLALSPPASPLPSAATPVPTREDCEGVGAKIEEASSRQDLAAVRPLADQVRGWLAQLGDTGDVATRAACSLSLSTAQLYTGTYPESLETAEQAATLARGTGDVPLLARALRDVAALRNVVGRQEDCISAAEEALTLYRQVADEQGATDVLSTLADVHATRDNVREAVALYGQIIKTREASGKRFEGAQARQSLALVYERQGQYQTALEELARAERVFEDVGDRSWQMSARQCIATIRLKLGETEQALESLQEIRQQQETAGDYRSLSFTLSALAQAYSYLGKHRRVLECLERNLALGRQLRDAVLEYASLSQLGSYLARMGDQRAGLGYLEQAAAREREVGARVHLATTLGELASARDALGKRAEARAALDEALSLARETGAAQTEADVLSDLGDLARRDGNAEEARRLLEQALGRERELGTPVEEALVLERLGELELGTGGPENALAHWEHALVLRHAAGDRGGEARVLASLARAEQRRGRADAALERIRGAIDIIESVRGAVPESDLRASYFATHQHLYETYVGLLASLDTERPGQGYAALALEASERARARGLLEALAKAEVDLRRRGDPALMAAEAFARARLGARERDRMRLLRERGVEDETRAVEGEIDTLAAELADLRRRIATASPRYASLALPDPANAAQIRQLLDEETVLLEYALGSERSHLFVTTASGIEVFVLPARAAVEQAVHRLRELLEARNARVEFERRDVRRARIARADASYAEAAAGLAGMVLRPAADRLATRRLVIVPDGALQYVSFAALPDPAGKEAAPLIAAHEIIVAPSAAVLAQQRRQAAVRAAASRQIVVFADPVFEPDDPRVRRARGGMPPQAGPGSDEPVRRTAELFGMRKIPRLDGSRAEAEEILSLVPAGQGRRALDFSASRSAAMSSEMVHYRILHFATHGFVDSERPELSGLVLSLVDETGRPQDGFLRLQDIYDLDVEADLVVLNACRTALGKDVRGEGLISLTRGFLHAGARRVVASLWSTNDRAAGALMKGFYRAFLKQGMPASAALRAAQLELRRDPRWRAPYYWAGLVLQGDWR
jgi:CHAT domain-containing protein/tetratricopeptide (TPR) repeat protein